MTLAATRAVAPAAEVFDMQALLADTAASRPDAPALICDDAVLGFGDLHAGALALAGALTGLGVRADERVAYLGRNAPAFVELLFGCAWIGAVPVAMNWRLAAPEVRDVLRDSTARVVVVEREFLPLLEAGGADAAAALQLVVVGGKDAEASGHLDYDELLRSSTPQAIRTPVAPQDTALQIYTSGTTGRPKGVMLSYANLAATIPDATRGWQLGADSVILSVLPWFHIAGTGPVLGAIWRGAATVMLNDARPDHIVDQLSRHHVSTVVLVSSLLQRILECPAIATADLSALRVTAYGAAPISPSVLRMALETLDCDLFQVYGLTETTGTIAFLSSADHDLSRPTTAARLTSCGLPLADIELRLVDPATGLDAASGGVGEIWVRSARTMTGYWRNPAATDAAVDAEGWFRTGDLASQDADGYLFLRDRLKDMIVSGGENIYPAEIENVLVGCPEVADVTVVGVPSSWGESPRAIVVPRPGVEPGAAAAAAVMQFARDRLAHYKCPTAVDFVTELPRNASGKVLKHLLREKYWHGHERRVN